MTTPQQKASFVKAKLQGASDTQAALQAKPYLKPASAPNAGMRLARNGDVQQALQKALKKHHITIDRTAKVISDALAADKTVVHGKDEDAFAEVVPDHTVRLAANKQAIQLLGLGPTQAKGPAQPDAIDPGSAKELAEAIRNGDEVRVTQAVWGKKDGKLIRPM